MTNPAYVAKLKRYVDLVLGVYGASASPDQKEKIYCIALAIDRRRNPNSVEAALWTIAATAVGCYYIPTEVAFDCQSYVEECGASRTSAGNLSNETRAQLQKLCAVASTALESGQH